MNQTIKKTEDLKKSSVAILTNFMDLNPGYSLTGIVVDQATMLLRKGHEVFLFVNEQYNSKFDELSGLESLLDKYSDKFSVVPKTPFLHLIDYGSKEDLTLEHQLAIDSIATTFLSEFEWYGIDVVFTHDFIFTGWNLPYSLGIKEFSEKTVNLKWYHWVHSIPSGTRDWWDLKSYGPNHRIVFPNHTDKNYVAGAFNTHPGQIEVIPHIKDIRTWYDVSEDVWDITERYPALLSSDIVQIYPASSDRLFAKQVDIIIKMFGFFKAAKATSFLLIANQWATGKQRREELNKYKKLGYDYGLKYGEDFIFSSDIKPEYETGLSKRVLRELQLFQNLFIFPTQAESFGLVGPESAFTGSLLVTNRSLTMMKEVLGNNTLSFDFGSFHQATESVKDDNYIYSLSLNIIHAIVTNPAIYTKTFVKKRYNMEHLYYSFYLPLL